MGGFDERQWAGELRESARDAVLLNRALGILHRMATERTGWQRFFSRWYYPAEPLRNDAANLVREAGFGFACMPENTRLVGDKDKRKEASLDARSK